VIGRLAAITQSLNHQIAQCEDSAMAKTATRGLELEPLDRLEDKVKRLVAMVDRMTGEQTRATEENQRLKNEIEALRARASSSEVLTAEISALKDERDVIRTRVGEMLDQLEALNL
jgi:FtsZ-binding cell division protein ZapB